MARLSPARRKALSLVSKRRRQKARLRDLARTDEGMRALSDQDRALAFRLALGATATERSLDTLIDPCLRKPASLEPRVRDALRLSAYEICFLDTPSAVAASQGVELVRSVAPRAAGLANAVLRRLVSEARPRIDQAREQVSNATASVDELTLVSGLPRWLVEQTLSDRGNAYVTGLVASLLEPAPVFIAGNARRRGPAEVRDLLAEARIAATPLSGLAGSYVLGEGSSDRLSPLITATDVVVADLSSQVVCRLAGPAEPGTLLEVGQGRGTKSLLLAAAEGAVWPSRIDALDTVSYKVALSRRRMEDAGLGAVVHCHEMDGRRLASDELPAELARGFDTVLLDAPCTGTGTIRRHPEIAATLTKDDVHMLVALQRELLCAAAARVAPGGTLVYATCSVLRAEDEAVVAAFLASEQGAAFVVESALDAPACAKHPEFAALVGRHMNAEGAYLGVPAPDEGDGHFCVRLRRQS